MKLKNPVHKTDLELLSETILTMALGRKDWQSVTSTNVYFTSVKQMWTDETAHLVHWLDYGLNDRDSIQLPGGEGIVFLRHCIQTDSGDRPASYPMGTGRSVLGSKTAEAWSRPHSSV
jgi:hypothetical protein